MEKIHENMNVLCLNTKHKKCMFPCNFFPFSAYFPPPPHYLIMIKAQLLYI